MANLVIDIGNTNIKMAVFNEGQFFYIEQTEVDTADKIDNILKKYEINRAIISSVKHEVEEWQAGLQKKVNVCYFSNLMAKGIINHYLTPETLGLDRLAAVLGAKYLYPEKNSIIIDGGTCITYDSVDRFGNYYGGSISPGLKMRYKALNNYTAGLPLIDKNESFTNSYGNSTETAILSGVQNGIKYELEGFINSYAIDGFDANIILTGGDTIFFDTLLKNSIFAPYIKIEPHLVLKGLNAAILNNND